VRLGGVDDAADSELSNDTAESKFGSVVDNDKSKLSGTIEITESLKIWPSQY
jgi:hypothetical protein